MLYSTVPMELLLYLFVYTISIIMMNFIYHIYVLVVHQVYDNTVVTYIHLCVL